MCHVRVKREGGTGEKGLSLTPEFQFQPHLAQKHVTQPEATQKAFRAQGTSQRFSPGSHGVQSHLLDSHSRLDMGAREEVVIGRLGSTKTLLGNNFTLFRLSPNRSPLRGKRGKSLHYRKQWR